MAGALYLIPVTLGDTPHDRVLPTVNLDAFREIRHFIVEEIRTARRFLKRCDPDFDIDSLTFYTLNKHTTPEEIASFIRPLERGEDVGLLSEAGCPAIADPGADIVAMAQEKRYKVVPLVGPSSILLGLMGSGFNGQSFAFQGYLPIDSGERAAKLKQLESRIYGEHQTQIFIETPYRNRKMIEDLIKHCRPQTKLCIAANVTCDDEYIVTQTLKEWSRSIPDLSKKPTIFLLYK